MRGHLPARDHGVMDPAPAPYMIRISGHLGATVLSAFPALAPQRHGAHTVLTGLRWFDASPRRATPKGHKTFIFHAAPHRTRSPT
jgi:hypothetical protein